MMKRFQSDALGLLSALVLAVVLVPQTSAAEQSKPAEEKSSSADTGSEEGKEMSEDTAAAEIDMDSDEFKQRMHEGDVALGVCGARVSALLWFYEASVAQGRDDLKGMVETLTESREVIRAEAERRAKEDKVDTTVRVMNKHSEELWDDLNEKAEGDTEEFQKAHDELLKGVKECLALFFDPAKGEEKAEEKTDG